MPPQTDPAHGKQGRPAAPAPPEPDDAEIVSFLLDTSGTITAWNPGVERLLLYPRCDWIGQRESVLYPPGEPATWERDRAQAVRSGSAVSIADYVKRDGARFRAEGVLTAQYDTDGALLGFSRSLRPDRDTPPTLWQAADRLQRAAEVARVGAWDYSPLTGELHWDARCRAAYGLPGDAPVDSSTFLAGIHPRDRAMAETAMARALRGEDGGEFDIEFRTVSLGDDGTQRWVASRGRVFFTAGGTAERVIGTIIDITARRKSEEALRERDEFLRRVVENSPDCIKTMTLDGHLLAINEGGQRMLEIDDFTELCGADWLTLWQDDTRAAVGSAIATAKAGGTGRFVGYCPTRKAAPRWWDVAVVAMLDQNGEPEFLLGVSRDITEQTLAAEQIAESEQRFSALFERATVGIALTDLNGRFVLANDRYCQTAGRTPEDLARLRLCDITHPDDRETGDAHFSRLIETGEEFSEDTRLLRVDGSVLWVGNSLSLIRRKADEPLYVQVVSVDLTERKHAEEIKERLQQRERTIATQLQEALIPSEPSDLPGLSLTSFYRPALVDEAGVGGDFFDVFAVEKTCTALVVGDLSGKGLTAASQVAIVRNMLRYAVYTGQTLVDAVSTLNRVLAEQDLLTGFATLFVGAYDQAERTLTYVNCGQEPALIWRQASRTVQELPPTGPVLGGFQEGAFTERVIQLALGDVLVVFTDGLTEVGPTRKRFLEVEGVADLLRHCCAANAEQNEDQPPGVGARYIRDSLIHGVDAYARNGIRDDIALLVGIVEGTDRVV
jgi:PAS domain S-box-containing protein